MDHELLNKMIAQLSALERIATILLSERLKDLPLGDRLSLEEIVTGKLTPPQTENLSLADDWAGRTLEYDRVIARILSVAQEIATLRAGQTEPE
jgi:hypothetical protein